MARIDYGRVEVRVSETEVFTLETTLAAMSKIGQLFKDEAGMRGAMQAASQFDPEGMAKVVIAGAGLDFEERDRLAETIFDYGAILVATPLIEYINGLCNPTGRAIEEEAEKVPGKPKKKTPPSS